MQLYCATRDRQARRFAEQIAGRLAERGVPVSSQDLVATLPAPQKLAEARLVTIVAAGETRVGGAPPQEGGQQDAMIRGMVERLATRLATSGGDADEWRRLIRAYTVLHEPDKAKEALASARKALAGDAEAGQQLDALARELGIGG
jgi:cytochrome c-type biogenesis protein CcmH